MTRQNEVPGGSISVSYLNWETDLHIHTQNTDAFGDVMPPEDVLLLTRADIDSPTLLPSF